MPAEVRADQDAERTWRRVVPKLQGAGVLSPMDGEALGHYCMLHALRDRAHATMAERRKADPAYEQSEDGQKVVKQVLDIGRAMRQVEAEFGMTPSSRSRIVLPSDRGQSAKDKAKQDAAIKTAGSFVRQAS